GLGLLHPLGLRRRGALLPLALPRLLPRPLTRLLTLTLPATAPFLTSPSPFAPLAVGSLGRPGIGRFLLVHLLLFAGWLDAGLGAGEEVGDRDRRARRRLAARRRRRLLAVGPLDLLLGAVEGRGGVHLDADVELPLELGELLTAAVLEGVGELRVEADL